jgi:hypothetical protein
MPDVSAAALAILDGVSKKKLSDVKDPKVRQYLTDVWGGLYTAAPALLEILVGPGEVVLSGKYASKTKTILGKIEEDVLAFKRKLITQAVFEELVWRRKRAIFALYKAQEATQKQITADKILSAAEAIAGILIKYGIPFILAVV